MRLLAIETATPLCSVALLCDGEPLALEVAAGRTQTEQVLPLVERLLAEAGMALGQLDAVAVGRGPGAFTGVRVAVGVAQGLAFGLDVPAVPVSTLAALALGAMRDAGAGRVLVALDARKGEVYWGAFRRAAEGVAPAGPERVCVPASVPLPEGEGWLGAGSGFAEHGEALAARLAGALAATRPQAQPHAADVARLAAGELAAGRAVAAEELVPVYLRDDVADVPGGTAKAHPTSN